MAGMWSLSVPVGVLVASAALVTSCRVSSFTPADAAPISGDGLLERVITDGLGELPTGDAGSGGGDAGGDGSPTGRDGAGAGDGQRDDSGDIGDARDAAGAGDAGSTRDGAASLDGRDAAAARDGGTACALLSVACPNRQACYPFPFEGPAVGETGCGFVGAGGPSVPCQSQLECDDSTFCSDPGAPDSVCALRCLVANPLCPVGTSCRALFFYPGAGICL